MTSLLLAWSVVLRKALISLGYPFLPTIAHAAFLPRTERVFTRTQAILDMLRIVAAIIMLGVGAWVFRRDTARLVLVPLDRMVEKVRPPHGIRVPRTSSMCSVCLLLLRMQVNMNWVPEAL